MSPGLRALVVEDDRSWQEILTEILTDEGLAVDIADSVDTAIAHLRSAPHRLAVVDLSLEGSDHANEDGLAALEAVRLYDPGCVPVLLSGYATVELAVSALTEYGAFTCLRKAAFQRAEFREVIGRALARAPTLPGQNGAEGWAEGGTSGGPARPSATPAEPKGGDAEKPALVVEDEAGWRCILSELLVEAGYRVRSCGSYGEALGCLRRERYRLAVIDLSLARPGHAAVDSEGYRLLTSTRAVGVPTVVVSGIASPEDIERVYAEHGVFSCLEKRAFDRRAFLQTVLAAEQAAAGSSDLDVLTAREREVLGLLVQGRTNREIGEALVITNNTVKRHLKSVFEKLQVHTRAAAVARAISLGMSHEAGIPGGSRDLFN